MWQFSCLPLEIKEHIFKYVHMEDRYETGRVSQEWFGLTLSTLDLNPWPAVDPEDTLLNDLIETVNARLKADSQWTWEDILDKIKYYCAVFDPGQKKFYEFYDITMKKATRIKFSSDGRQLIPKIALRNLDDLSPYASLIVLMLASSNANPTIGFTKNLSAQPDSSRFISSLDLKWDLNFNVQLLLDFIKKSTTLKMVKFHAPVITLDWENLFSERVQKINLKEAVVDSNFPNETAVLGRSVLLHCSANWSAVKYFKFSTNRRTDDYICKPTLGKEYVTVTYSNLESTRPEYEHLKFTHMKMVLDQCPEVRQPSLPCPVTKVDARLEGINAPQILNNICEESPQLKMLSIEVLDSKSLAMVNFKAMHQITFLEMQGISVECLGTILVYCKSLQSLKLDTLVFNLFSEIRNSLKSSSIARLELSSSAVDIYTIVKHFPNLKEFICSDYYVPKVVSSATMASINQLLYMHLKTKSTRSKRFLMDLVQCELPNRALWYSANEDLEWTCVFSRHVQAVRNALLVNNPEFVYISGLSTRFITARGKTKLANSINDLFDPFLMKLYSI